MRFKLLRIGINNDLILINLLVIALTAVIVFSPFNTLRIVLGLPFLLFLPGYTLIAALFTKKAGIDGIERVILSFGTSIVAVALIGFLLNYTPWGIKVDSILYSLMSFIFITSVVAWLRRKRLPRSERFGIRFGIMVPGLGGGAWDKALSIILGLTILGALGTLGYVITNPKVGERFTEFYILAPDGKIAGYPKELLVGEEAKVIVGVINREHERVSYRIEVRMDERKGSEIGPLVLEHDEEWEGQVSFVPDIAGDNQKLEFTLYKNGQDEPWLAPLRLWVNVKERK